MPVLEDNLALYIPNGALRYFQSALPLLRESRVGLVFDEDIHPDTDFLSLEPRRRITAYSVSWSRTSVPTPATW